MTPDHLTVKIEKAAIMLDVCTRTIRRMIDAGDLKAIQRGRSILVVVASIYEYINRSMICKSAPR